ncbi:hypothetical protein CTAYLR_007243 [Chrysophaeum taylorii]|uniref:Poly [ADP-ribose] polymerase n=1 Tax=Chrysophaeum taylorii TaxID=2483200 RepID=A0AAD7XH74_9STRA|nr:hypothetical protein CTAYLR_007243 [Chrysophaeum taylorii]
MMLWIARVAGVVAAGRALQFNTWLNMTITSQVRGAVYPVTRNGTACTSEQYAETPCSCYGGAARRADMIQNEKSLAIDFSSHFFGSGGLFYDEFRGLASAHFMHHCGYSARGLGAYDFLAGVSDDEPTGGKILAAQLSASGVVTVATNLDVSGDPYLEGLVSTYAIVYEQGVSVAVLSLLDCRDVAQASSYYGARCLPYMDSISSALSVLAVVDRVVLLVTGVPEDDADALLTVAEKEEASPDYVEVAAIMAIVTKYVTIDLVLVDGEIVSKLNRTLQSMRNVAGQLVHVAAMAFEPGGVSTTHITLARESASLRRIDLDCEVPENVAMRELLDVFEEQVETGLEETEIGWIPMTLDAALEYEGEGCVDLNGRSVCGCAVAECAIGNLVADAVRWYGDDADVALVDASRTLKASLEAFRVTRAKALAVAPDTADELCRLYVSGAKIRKLLEKSIESNGGKGFLQVSSSLRLTWADLDGVPVLGDAVYIHEEMMSDDATYAVVASNSVVWDDILDDDDDTQKVMLYGVSHYEALSRYLLAHHNSLPTELNPEVAYNIFGKNGNVSRRIEQTPSITLIHIAVLCDEASSSIERRESCDHTLSTIDLINAPHDGYHDELLPNTRLVAHSAFVTCATDGKGYDTLKELAASIFPSTLTAVFAWCSTELVAIASNDARARYAFDFPGAPPYVVSSMSNTQVLGPASTSTLLSDEIAFPYVARFSTPDTVIGAALSELTLTYDWSRVALVYDDTIWSVSSAEAFADAFVSTWETKTGAEIRGTGECVDGGACERFAHAKNGITPIGVPFSLADFDAGILNIESVVKDISSLDDVFIVVVASMPHAQRAIYAACATHDVKFGAGFAWLTTWPSLESIEEHGGTVNLDALNLHEGALGFIEHSPVYGERNATTSYLNYWSLVADNDACWNRSLVPASGTFVRRGSQRYCDADGDRFTATAYGLIWADAVLVLATALDVLGGTTTDAAAIYQAIKALDYPISSASGPIFLSEGSGDRVGVLDLKNLQIVDGEDRKLSQSTIIVSGSSAKFVTVGSFEAASEVLSVDSDAIVFPGGSLSAPRDRVAVSLSNDKKGRGSNATILVVVIIVVGVVVVIMFVWFLVLRKREEQRVDKMLREAANIYVVEHAFTEEDVQQVAEFYEDVGPSEAFPWGPLDDADTLNSNSMYIEVTAASSAGTTWTNTLQNIALRRELWCWEIDPSETIPETSQVIEERWVSFEESVQDHLSELLHRYKLLPDEMRDIFGDRDSGESDTLLYPTELYDPQGSSVDNKPQTPVDCGGEPTSYSFAFDSLALFPNINSESQRIVINVAKMELVNVSTKKRRKLRAFEGARNAVCEWYWNENLVRHHSLTNSMQRPRGWIKFKARAQEPLTAAYRDYLDDPSGSVSVLYFTADHEITDEDDECAHWLVDFKTMMQTNLCDQHKDQPGFERRVWPFMRTLTMLENDDGRVCCEVPEAIRGKELLWLTLNTRVLVLNQDDDWGYGTRLDGDDGSGWFPMACVKRAEMPACESKLLKRPVGWTEDDELLVPLTSADVTLEHERRLVTSNGAKERQEIVRHFDTKEYDVLSVKRIQNIKLWRSYVIQLMNAQNAAGEPVSLNGVCEKRPVFHGTDEKNTDLIIKRGFNRDFCSPNVQHGRGVYFATDSRYSIVVADEDHLAYPEYLVKFQLKHLYSYFPDVSTPF